MVMTEETLSWGMSAYLPANPVEVDFQSREELHAAQKKRAKKYGIEIRPDGHLTKPKEWADLPDDQFADPVNYMYPVHDKVHCRVALVYFIRYKYMYKKPESRYRVLYRILRSCIDKGVSVRWDTIKSNFPDIADKLPPAIKSKLVGYKQEKSSKKEGGQTVNDPLRAWAEVYEWLKSRGISDDEAMERATRISRWLA